MKLIIMNGTCLTFGMMFNPYGVNKPSGPCFLQFLMPYGHRGWCWCLQFLMPYGHRDSEDC